MNYYIEQLLYALLALALMFILIYIFYRITNKRDINMEDNKIKTNRSSMTIKAFDKGWWNCFNSFVIEIYEHKMKSDTSFLDNVLKGAGVERSEIINILKTEIVSDYTKGYLQEYLALHFISH